MSRSDTPTRRNRVEERPKYQVLMELGRGGMGVVTLAMFRGPQGFVKLVVLKMLKAELLGSIASHRMFSEEARISARLSHPNVVQIYEVTEHDGAPTIVMEYLDGQPLTRLFDLPTTTLPLRLHVLILSKVLAGLHACHELKDYNDTPLRLVHRDISPHNVFVLYDGQVKVVDFGIAKTAESKSDTRAGDFKGKVRYIAPEQVLTGDHDRRVDVFAVGVILAEAITGRRFWGERSESEVMLGLLSRQLPPTPSGDGVPPALAVICRRALAADPDERYATALDFQRDLEQYLDQEGAASGEDIASFMGRNFAGAREERNGLIHAQITLADRLSLRPAAPDESTITNTTGSRGSYVETARFGKPPPRARSTMMALGAALAAVIGIVALSRVYAPGARTSLSLPAAGAAAPSGASSVACAGGTKACDGTCASKQRPDLGCGSDDCTPCTVSNATARCNSRQRCDVAICYRGYEDCDGDVDNGCETNVRVDPDHCGACATRCPDLPHATRGCGDVCTIWRCEAGYSDCNRTIADGCEVHVAADRANCGHCGNACPAGRRCEEGRCQ